MNTDDLNPDYPDPEDEPELYDQATVAEFANRVREAYEQIWGDNGLTTDGEPFLLRGVIVGLEIEYLNGEESSYIGIRSMPRHSAIRLATIMRAGWVKDAIDDESD